MSLSEEQRVLDKLGLDYTILDSGCCGMAGGFGFERDHYDVSIAVGERVLLPAVRAAPADTLIITDGFSCREQIAQTTGRKALHLAEVLQLALRDEGGIGEGEDGDAGHTWTTGAIVAGAVAGGALLTGLVHRRLS
jgi:hypothetical protein